MPEVSIGCLLTNLVWYSCWLSVLRCDDPAFETDISSKIDRSAMRSVDSFEDGFAQGGMCVNCR
jgi:hypothetical protein